MSESVAVLPPSDGSSPDVAPPALPPSQWADLGGPTHWVDFGGPADAPVLVCVHGLGGSLLNWMALAPLLTDTVRVVALDLVGHGRTPPAGRPATLDGHRTLVDRFVREIVGGPVTLVGNSMGGTVSLLQASNAPETVAGVVLVNPAVPAPRLRRPDPAVTAVFAVYSAPFVGERILSAMRAKTSPEKSVAETGRLCAAHPERIPAEVTRESVALARDQRDYPDVSHAFLSSARSLLGMILLRPKRLHAVVRAVTAPTLLLHGKHDRLIPVEAARLLAASRPDWQFEVHDDAGHIPQLEAAGWTAGQIRAWLPEPVQPARKRPARVRPSRDRS